MKKVGKSTKKGFTLVELIVVLVILAVLAAMLVPALTGYITRARQEKDYQMAATALTAAQSAATFQYSTNTFDASAKITKTTSAGNGETVMSLIGDDGNNKITDISFDVNAKGVVTGGYVTINGYKYTYQPGEAEMWKSEKAT